MRDHFHFSRPFDGSDVRENLRARSSRGIDWSVLEVFEGLNRVLRSLGHQVVADAIIEIEEKHGRDLEAAAEGVQHAVGNVALGVPALGRLGTIHGHIELRVIKRLLYARIGNTRNLLDLMQHAGCDLAIALDIGSLDLDINGCRQTKVQDLRNDVRGQEVERGARVFPGQRISQALNILCSGVMIFLEGHQNIGVARSDEARRAVHKINRAVRQPDVVQDVVRLALGNLTPYRAFDEIAQLRGLFDSRAALGAKVEDELTVVAARKEVLAEPRDKEERSKANQKKGGDEKGPAMDKRCE